MLHARKDYNDRIQDSAGIIPEDEPVFLLRGQDAFAPFVLELYARMVEQGRIGDAIPNQNIIRNTRAHATAMRVWQETEASKAPDMNTDDSVY